MSSRPSAGAMNALMISGVAARVFYGLMIDSPEVHNGAWLSVFLGMALAMPIVRAMKLCAAVPRLKRFMSVPLCALVALDAARAVDIAAYSAGYVAFLHGATPLLTLPLLAVALWAMGQGGEAVGNAALLLVRPVAALLILLAALQWPAYRPGWLAPVLGFGITGIVCAAVRAAGWMALISGALLALAPEDAPPLPMQRNLMASGLACAALIALRLMMAPAMDVGSMNRLNQLDALLTNGRAPLYLQLPMIAAWFVALMNLICLECWAASALLEQSFALRPGWRIGGVTLAVALCTLLRVAEARPLRELLDGQYWLLAVACAMCAIIAPGPNRRTRPRSGAECGGGTAARSYGR